MTTKTKRECCCPESPLLCAHACVACRQEERKTLAGLTIAEVLANPAASRWLKGALRALARRGDPLGAVNDAEALVQIMRGHVMRSHKEDEKCQKTKT